MIYVQESNSLKYLVKYLFFLSLCYMNATIVAMEIKYSYIIYLCRSLGTCSGNYVSMYGVR